MKTDDPRYVAKIARIIDSYRIVVNKGANAGLKVGQRLIVIGIGETISDPETNEELGVLEIVKGEVEVIHVQEKIATLKSCHYETSPDRHQTPIHGFGQVITIPGERYLVKLANVQVGDLIVKESK
jgi:hypothetical protein